MERGGDDALFLLDFFWGGGFHYEGGREGGRGVDREEREDKRGGGMKGRKERKKEGLKKGSGWVGLDLEKSGDTNYTSWRTEAQKLVFQFPAFACSRYFVVATIVVVVSAMFTEQLLLEIARLPFPG